MKVGSLMLFLFSVVIIGVLFISTPRDRKILLKATTKIALVVRAKVTILIDKLYGVDPFYIDASEDVFEKSKSLPENADDEGCVFEHY